MKLQSIRQSINFCDLTCWYQPIYDVKSDILLGYEALMRDKKRITLDPMEVFQNAQLLGEHNILDKHLIIKAQQLFGKLKEYSLFINILPSTLLQRDFISWWDKHSENIPNIVLELSETERIDDWQLLKSTLEQLRARNVKFAVDDMGMGYTSPQYWIELEPEYIKLDKYYLLNAVNDKKKQRIIESLIRMVGDSAQIIIEGIEDAETLELVKGLGACYAQGYLLGMPSPINKIDNSLSVLL
ncbi:EAL domain-containing protein [Clostridium swellfunianum]|uniref:EAL domain-containing protein n=1 Tax=Clostridium swellfunianum TaxID=1367462 RepID=UPI00202F5E23|nr:EAL domain-containing protein [Clostridium swellfunianum]MCM0647236.1 EAL domain-containing protein [Clostridium swellfunianum]